MAFLTRRKTIRPPMENLELLCTASDEVELAMIRGLLEDAGIALFTRDRDGTSYLRVVAGFSMYGTDIYVDRDDLPRAKDLVDSCFEDGDNEPDEEAYDEPDEEAYDDADDALAGEEDGLTDEEIRAADEAEEAAERENMTGPRVRLWHVLLAIALILLAAFAVGRL